jgi:RsiW-degrading membrane proteinase PrsW (M82 family)
LRTGPLHLSWTRERYWRILLGGFALYLLVSHALIWSHNIKFLPTMLLLGSFVVPVAFVAFLYENETFSQMSVATVALAFLLGGVLGTVAAQFAEGEVVAVFPPLLLVLVGFIEEAAKLLGVIWWFRRPELNTEAHGLVLGAAAGMGFAALETMGVGLEVLIASKGNVGAIGPVLMSRGLLSPLAHGTWTAILAATIWREKAAGRPILAWPVLRAYLLVSVLHGLWDFSQLFPRINVLVPWLQLPVPLLLIGAVGIWVLHRRMVESRVQPMAPA